MPRSRPSLPRSVVGCCNSCKDTRSESVSVSECHRLYASRIATKQVQVSSNSLIAHPDCAEQYSELKRTLAAQYPNDIDGCMDDKDEFVKTMAQRSLHWRGLV
ncbi:MULTISPECIES: GrpB family protein [Cyanophyceae]|uniref:GrpB family protein n=1 Tax=Cyanophyceae TaxID=3028117 RepID=UPI0018F05A2C|nr:MULTISPECIES: GrpB family protein [unclassified Phormidium]